MIKSFEAEPGLRLDVFLCRQLEGTSRSFVKRLIERGQVRVGGRPRPPSYHLKQGEAVELDWREEASDPGLPVLYEDDDLLMVDKPSGLLVHPSGETWLRNPDAVLAESEATVVGWVLRHRRPAEGLERCGLVHRLDKETSGVMAVAKTPEAQAELQDQFRTRTAEKVYLAVVDGSMPAKKGRIEAPVGRVGRRLAATPYGREAASAYKVLRTGKGRSLVEVRPMTGRTHQIRVHLKAVGCPVAGDAEYGGSKAPRLMLHAHRLKVKFRGKTIEAISPPPKDFLI